MAELGEEIIVEGKEASRIYNKGAYGIFDGKKLKLDLIEACYLLEKEKIEIEKENKKIDLKKFIQYAIKIYPDFEIKYLVYRDLKERGYILKPDEIFHLYQRGSKPPAQPTHVVIALSERAIFSIKELEAWLEKFKKKNLIIGIVDEEGDLTYYFIKFFRMKGKFVEREYEGKIYLLNDRSIVWDKNLIEKLKEDFIGRELGKFLQLSLTETAYISERGAKIVKNGRKMGIKRFMNHAKKIQTDIEERLRVYKELRAFRLLPKTGFKFGSHFRVYDGSPENTHAPYLVHVIKNDYKSSWAEISRAVRLANSVKKEMVFASVGDEVKYIRLKRITP